VIAAVSLSWGGPGAHPYRYRAGVIQLEDAFGVTVRAAPHALSDPAWLARNPRARADDLMWAFEDPDVAAIVSTIGGDDSIRLLPLLEVDLMRSHPKVFLGYSDSPITQMACLRAGLVSFYGPAIMAGFAENGGIHRYTFEGVRRLLFEPEERLRWPDNVDGWTVEFLDWDDAANQDSARSLRPSEGWRWFGDQAAEGPIVAACLEVLDWLRGTPWWPDLDGAVLAIETSEEQPPPAFLSRFMRSLAASGELHRLAAVLVGRPGGADLPVDHHGAYDEAVVSVVRDEEGLVHVPVVTRMDFGHTDPMWTIPIGIPTRIDPGERCVEFMTPGVA
jgi:muramoyltetrapeptide carboxypeptidase LdcA involved in peptidoglycan recycling